MPWTNRLESHKPDTGAQAAAKQDLHARDSVEKESTAAEASKAVLSPIEVYPYVDPHANTPHFSKYTSHLLGYRWLFAYVVVSYTSWLIHSFAVRASIMAVRQMLVKFMLNR